MRRIALWLIGGSLLWGNGQGDGKEKTVLWYGQPAAGWNEALPVGNGKAGAMVYGGVECEELQLNENTLYSGEPSVVFKDVKITPQAFDSVVGLLKEKKYTEAGGIICKNWLGRLHQYYQPFGSLFIQNNRKGKASSYRRALNIDEAVASVEYSQGGIKYKREVFASYPDNVIVVRLTCNRANGIDVTLRFDSPHPTAKQTIKGSRLILSGKAPGYVERRSFEDMERWGDQYKHPELYDAQGKRKYDKRILYEDEIDHKGMLFEAQLEPVFAGEGICEATDSGLHVYHTKDVYFILALTTSFNGYNKSPSSEGVNPSAKGNEVLGRAIASSGYHILKERHIRDYQSLFNRVSLHLLSTDEQMRLPTDRRIIAFAEKDDPNLAALLFQYGRYLMISGSRPGGQPLNLQGLWNKEVVPPWNSGYTININTEMNYWPAEPTNLSECHEPLFRMIEELAVSGAETARNMYNRRGWVAHHNTSIWRETLPNDNVPTASFWPMAQGWLCRHLWERFVFTDDTAFLQATAYPLMRGAALFYADWLIDSEGFLVTPAGISPENAFLTDEGKQAAFSMGTTMDMAIIRETFSHVVRASEILNTDRALREELFEKLSRLLPYQTGKSGQLQEWMYDFKEAEPHHRHLSHLYGLYPGNQITMATPALYKAAEKSLTLRGDEATGWSMGWKINCWARLQDGNHAYKIIARLFNPVGFGDRPQRQGGGLYLNMLDAHPPFQIDGNFGYTAGVAEMLLQSHAGYIQLLPALPDAWAQGEVTGLKARGNFEVSIKWEAHTLYSATIRSQSANKCTLRASVPFEVRKGKQSISRSVPLDNFIHEATFDTQKDAQFLISATAN